MDNTLERVLTKGAQLKKDENFKVVVFTKKRNVKQKPREKRTSRNDSDTQEFNIKQATKEIIKLGVKGFYERRRNRTLKSLAVELGAKPEKNRYHNYKDLKDIRQMQKERREKHLNMLKESSNLSAFNQYRRKHTKKYKKKVETNILNNYGKRKK
ncbi:hypothetical protein PGB90_001927 [Kerria lacca]